MFFANCFVCIFIDLLALQDDENVLLRFSDVSFDTVRLNFAGLFWGGEGNLNWQTGVIDRIVVPLRGSRDTLGGRAASHAFPS